MTVNKNKWLCVFDFDETLITSEDHKVVVTHKDNTQTLISSNEWVHYKPQDKDIFDFSHFENLENPQKNMPVWNIFKARSVSQLHDLFVLSARESSVPLFEFFQKEKLYPHIICLSILPGENNGIHKARWISEEIETHGYRFVEFYDDRDDNISEVRRLRKKFPNTTFKIVKVVGNKLIET